MIDAHLDVCVATLTFRRPALLARLIEHWSHLEVPEETTVRFLVVDNDSAASARETVNSLQGLVAVSYVVEAEPGIPAARNRALAEAQDRGVNLLCFTDDDGYPETGWLRELVSTHRSTSAVLTCGPRRLHAPTGLDGIWRQLVARSIVAHSRLIERWSARYARQGKILTSGTYNWMVDSRWAACNKVRFDLAFRDSGGEDSAFRKSVEEFGAVQAWSPRAVVNEDLELDRVSVRYQFNRFRGHGIIAVNLDHKVGPGIVRRPIGKVLIGAGLIVLPVFGSASFMLGLQLLGMAVGEVQARRGGTSTLYARRVRPL